MKKYNSEKEYFWDNDFRKAYFDYWKAINKHKKISDDLFAVMVNGKIVKEAPIKDIFKGLEKLETAKWEEEEKREKLREAEKKLRSFSSN